MVNGNVPIVQEVEVQRECGEMNVHARRFAERSKNAATPQAR